MNITEMMISAIPPDDFKGSIGNWMTELQARGLWNGVEPSWYGDLHIPRSEWWSILEKLEN